MALLALIGSALLFALMTIGVFTHDIALANRASLWPTSEGIVTFSKAAQRCVSNVSYSPEIRYQYGVDGQNYVGDHLVFGNTGCGIKARADSIVQQFQRETPVAVHFNPANPAESVLVVGEVFEDTWLGIYLFTGVAFVLGMLGVFVARKY